MKITDLSDADGYWTATVHIGEHPWRVDRKHGSWRVIVSETQHCDIRATVAAELQEHVHRIEKARVRSAPA